jgi:GH24 family phage-related lysozyme (muramidase)
MNLQIIKDRIKKHEGYRDMVYEDHLGFKTVGYGHLVVEDGFIPGIQYSKKELEEVFEKDFAIALKDATKLVGNFDIDDKAFGVVIEMCFQLGFPKVSKFKFFLSALQKGDYETAAMEMESSRWHKQTPERCEELIEIIRRCKTNA